MQPLPFIGGSYTARSLNFDASKTINLYAEASGSGQSKSIAMLIGCPGTRRFATLAGGGVRGCIRFSAAISVVVIGANVYTVTTAGVGTLIGSIDFDVTPVSMASNGQVIMLVTGAFGYQVNPTAPTAVAQITNTAFLGADRVDYIDGYFVFNKPGTAQFQITGLLTTNIDPLDFASAEGAPDLLISLLVDHREVWLFGETSTEVFFNSGNSDFPFERIQGAFIQQGCAAKNTPARLGNSVAWLSANEQGQGMVLRAEGYQPTRISTHAVEYAIAQYSRIDDAIGFTYQCEGHSFYVLTFPTANATWVYDDNTQLWHERAWRNPADGSLNRHRAQCVMAFSNKIIVGDWENPYLYIWDLDTYTDDGGILPAIRQVPHAASPDNCWQFFHKLWIDMETGVGLNGTVQGSDPQVMLQWSDDGGHVFGTEVWATAGKIGDRKRRVNFRRMGRSRDRVFRMTFTDPVKRIFIGAGVEMTEGYS
jgi:hypothetical protein